MSLKRWADLLMSRQRLLCADNSPCVKHSRGRIDSAVTVMRRDSYGVSFLSLVSYDVNQYVVNVNLGTSGDLDPLNISTLMTQFPLT